MAICTIHSRPAAPCGRENTGGATTAMVDRRYCAAEMFDALCDAREQAWLGAREQAEFAAWHEPRRRRAWLVGRILGKQLVAANRKNDLAPAEIEILSLNRDGRGSRPRVFCGGAELPWSLSVSHTDRGVLAALSPDRVLRAALVWTDVPDLMEISSDALDAALARISSP